MRYFITDRCNNCMDCLMACAEEAIHPAGDIYSIGGESFQPLSNTHPFIVQDECDGCESGGDPRCIAVCDLQAVETNMLV